MSISCGNFDRSGVLSPSVAERAGALNTLLEIPLESKSRIVLASPVLAANLVRSLFVLGSIV